MRRILISCLLLLPALAQGQRAHSPGNLGLALGAPEQEIFEALRAQGFTLQPGGEREHIRGTRDLASITDFVLVVTPANGSVDIWGSENVLLGFHGGRLVFTSEVSQFEREEAELVFSQIVRDWSALEEVDIRQKHPSQLGRDGIAVHRDFYSLVYFMSIDSHVQSEWDQLHAVRSGETVYMLALRPSVKSNRRGSTRLSRTEGVIVITYIDYCALPHREIYTFTRPGEDQAAIDCDEESPQPGPAADPEAGSD